MKRPNVAAHLLACVLVYIALRVALAAAHVAPRTPVQLMPPMVMKSHRIRLNPLNSQEDYFNRASGTARLFYGDWQDGMRCLPQARSLLQIRLRSSSIKSSEKNFRGW